MAPSLKRLLATGFLSAGVAHAGTALAAPTDAQVLVQQSLQSESHATAALQSRFQQQRRYTPDCRASPKLCQAPMMCQEPLLDPSKPLAMGGQPNYHSWCGLPHEKAAVECVAGNFSGYATLMHKAQLNTGNTVTLLGQSVGKGMDRISAHYCFSFGHCDNTIVTPSTTTDDMVAMCDTAFGRKNWEKMTASDMAKIMQPIEVGGAVEFESGFKNPHLSPEAHIQLAKMSCAQGSFHCDTFYCKQEFCNSKRWKKKFDHLRRPSTGEDVSGMLQPGLD
mmetsp:Transcript_145075/g.352248  ORF Transcript_145075/g.352248 Transcript_145075/m.352248 type:complete len:278 (-) Transcript_145075:50-883(-)